MTLNGAIKQLHDLRNSDAMPVYFKPAIAEVINVLLSDVRENVKGRWVEVVDRTEMYDKEGVKTWGMLFQCNQCGFVLNAIEGHTGQYNYCPNCGADMRGDNHD